MKRIDQSSKLFSYKKPYRIDRNHFIVYTKFPFGMWFWLEVPGVLQVEKREHRRSYDMYKSVARLTGVVPLLLFCTAVVLRGWCLNAKKVWVGICPSLFRMARPYNTHTRTHIKTPFLAVTKRRYWSTATTYCYCYTVAATTSKAYGVIQAHSSSSKQHSKNEK